MSEIVTACRPSAQVVPDSYPRCVTPPAQRDDPIDPKAFLRALLHITPEDAEQARQDSPATRRQQAKEGPTHDYGDDGPPED